MYLKTRAEPDKDQTVDVKMDINEMTMWRQENKEAHQCPRSLWIIYQTIWGHLSVRLIKWHTLVVIC